MGLSSSVGNASSFLYGIQAKRVSLNGSCAGASVPQSAKPGLFSSSCGEPASFFTGVVAGTTGHRTRRWQIGGGREKKAQVDNFESQVLSSGSSGAFDTVPEVCPGPGEVYPGSCEALFGGAETEFRPGFCETEADDVVPECRPGSSEAVLSGVDSECCPGSGAGENALNDHENASHGAASAWSGVEPGYQR